MKDILNSIKFNFLYVDKYSFGRSWEYPENIIPYSMLRCVIKGSAEFHVDGEKYIVKKNQIAYIPEGCKLYCAALEENFTFISVRFKSTIYYEGANFLSDYFLVPTVIESDAVLNEYFKDIYNWVFRRAPSRIFHIRGTLELIIARILDNNNKNPAALSMPQDKYSIKEIKRRVLSSAVKEDTRITVVIEYITSHPTEHFTCEQMSDMTNMSQTSFRRLFKQQTGKAPLDFIRDFRLTTAARKLLVSTVSINDLAYDLGFEDPNYFIRIFKKNYGVTPRQYRNSIREESPLDIADNLTNNH